MNVFGPPIGDDEEIAVVISGRATEFVKFMKEEDLGPTFNPHNFAVSLGKVIAYTIQTSPGAYFRILRQGDPGFDFVKQQKEIEEQKSIPPGKKNMKKQIDK